MFYTLLSGFILLLGATLIYSAVRTLSRSHWLLGWLRGTFGFLLVAMAIGLGLIAFDIFSYQQLLKEKPVATLSFKEQGEQHYLATLVHNDGTEADFELRGDQWQLDARIIKWQGFLAALGIKPGYRLDRISGRYYTLEDERTAERTVYPIGEREWRIDIWQWLRRYPNVMPLMDADYGSATFVPMRDNALFEVRLSNTGLLARPLNDPARQAVTAWDD